MAEQDCMERMLPAALPPIVEACNASALGALAAKIGSTPEQLLQEHGHTLIAKCLYEGACVGVYTGRCPPNVFPF